MMILHYPIIPNRISKLAPYIHPKYFKHLLNLTNLYMVPEQCPPQLKD